MIKVKDASHDDLATLMDTGERETPGITVSQRRAKAKRQVPFTDRRRNNGPRRTEQCNVRLTLEMMNEMMDIRVVHDLTQVELIERAVRHYIAAVRAGEVNAGVEKGNGEAA